MSSSMGLENTPSGRNAVMIAPEVNVVTSSGKNAIQAKISEALPSVSRLNFDSLGLVGREMEKDVLTECFERLVQFSSKTTTSPSAPPRHSMELVLISGLSGAGKTSLAYYLRDSALLKRHNGIFVGGKYDLDSGRNQPLSGIGAACNEACRTLLKRGMDGPLTKVRREIGTHMDNSQIELLTNIVPLLGTLLTSPTSLETSPTNSDSTEAQASFENTIQVAPRSTANDEIPSKEAFQFALRTFLRIVASNYGPTVIFLDDLQFADAASIELLKGILMDSDMSNLMILGSFRSDEVDENHMLSAAISDVKAYYEEHEIDGSGVHVSEIELSNLSQRSLTDMLMELLSVSDKTKVKGLARICYKRTLGNAFFFKVFLLTLSERSLLKFDIGGFQWTWDEDLVESETAATDNVIELIVVKMKKFSEEMTLLLQMASCLGNCFSKAALDLVWTKLHSDFLTSRVSHQRQALEQLLQDSIRDILLEAAGGNSYRFVHDRIQEACLLIPSSVEIEELRYAVGACLYEHLDKNEMQSMIFVVVNLLNYGTSCSLEVAALNLQAAEKAAELSAFATAARYVKMGILNLKDTEMWKSHFSLALKLHSIGAEAERASCNKEKAVMYCEEVTRQPKATPQDKLRVNKVMFDIVKGEGQYDAAWKLCLDTLDDLGCHFPQSRGIQRIMVAKELRGIKRLVPSMDQVDMMPFMADAARRETLGFLLMAAGDAIAHSPPLYILICCRCLKWTKRFGLTSYSASLFASLASLLMHKYGDWDAAVDLAEVALAIQARLASNFSKASTIYKTNSFVLGWVKPLKTCGKNLIESHRLGMLSGNIESGCYALWFSVCARLYAGTPLSTIAQDVDVYIRQADTLGNVHSAHGMRYIYQAVLNLRGGASNPHTTTLKGDATSGSGIEDHPIAQYGLDNISICFVSVYFAEFQKGAAIALSVGDSYYEQHLGSSFFGHETFFRGLCLYAMARETSQRKYKTAAADVKAKLRTWVKKGGVNYVHQLHIFNAEEAALKGDFVKAKKSFDKAIVSASRGGFIQNAALANERLALCLLSWQEMDDAKYHMREAVKLYSEWGACRKTEMLESKYADLLRDG